MFIFASNLLVMLEFIAVLLIPFIVVMAFGLPIILLKWIWKKLK